MPVNQDQLRRAPIPYGPVPDKFLEARRVQAEERAAKAREELITELLGEERKKFLLTEAALERANALLACIQKTLADAGFRVKDDLKLYEVISDLVNERDRAIARAQGAEDVARNLARKQSNARLQPEHPECERECAGG